MHMPFVHVFVLHPFQVQQNEGMCGWIRSFYSNALEDFIPVKELHHSVVEDTATLQSIQDKILMQQNIQISSNVHRLQIHHNNISFWPSSLFLYLILLLLLLL